LKVRVVSDVRRHQFEPVVEFDAGERAMFWTCPCGCGTIGEMALSAVFATRNPVEVRKLIIGPDEKNCAGDLLPLGIVHVKDDGEEEIHWAGYLERGEWRSL